MKTLLIVLLSSAILPAGVISHLAVGGLGYYIGKNNGSKEVIIEKPRTFYLLGQSLWGYSLGAPVFTTDGKLIGIVLLRSAKTQTDQDSGFIFSNLNQAGMMPVILPASDIVDGAKQAREAKAPAAEEKPATEKTSTSDTAKPAPGKSP